MTLHENNWLIRIAFTLRIEEDRIADVRFQAQSCVTTVACASALTEMIQGKSLSEVLSLTPQELSEALGIIPPEKMYCCELVVATLQNALKSPQCPTQQQNSSKGEVS